MVESIPEGKKFCECGCGELINAFWKDPRGSRKLIPRRYVGGHNQRGKRPWNYKGVRKSNGYLFVGSKRQHRLIYEEYYKCCLLKWVDVHHINGDKHDNRIENLEAISKSKHSIYHCTKDMTNRKCSICGSKTTLASKKGWKYWYKFNEGFLCSICYGRFSRKRN